MKESPQHTGSSDPDWIYGDLYELMQSLGCLPMFSEDVEKQMSELLKRSMS